MTILQFPNGHTPEPPPTDPEGAARRILEAMDHLDRDCARQLLTSYLGMFRALGHGEGLAAAQQVLRSMK